MPPYLPPTFGARDLTRDKSPKMPRLPSRIHHPPRCEEKGVIIRLSKKKKGVVSFASVFVVLRVCLLYRFYFVAKENPILHAFIHFHRRLSRSSSTLHRIFLGIGASIFLLVLLCDAWSSHFLMWSDVRRCGGLVLSQDSVEGLGLGFV